MFRTLTTSAATMSLLLLLSAPALAQDISGTWFKANVSARLLASDFFEEEDGGPIGGSFTGKPKTVAVKQVIWFQLTELDDEDEYAAQSYIQTSEGLLPIGEAYLTLKAQGIIEELELEVPIIQKTPKGIETTGSIDVEFSGQLTVKFDDDMKVKSAKISVLGGVARGDVPVNGKLGFGVGAAKLKAKSVPEDKVPGPLLKSET